MNFMEIRSKMKTVSNIHHIVHSMETLATMKIIKLRADVEKRKIYSTTLQQLLSGLITLLSKDLPENALLDSNSKENRSLILLFTSDRGFCGNMNPILIGQTRTFLRERANSRVICIGKKAGNALIQEGFNVLALVDKRLENADFLFAQNLASDVVNGFLNQTYDSVYVSYMSFQNILIQKPTIRKILPIEKISQEKRTTKYHHDYESFIISPNPKAIFSFLARKYVDAIMYQILLEAATSEQAIRMMSMRSASENADKVFQKMKQDYQKMRQEKITRELIELSSNLSSTKRRRS